MTLDIPVLITSYNKRRFIRDAVTSALNNSQHVFVVDDCSTDGSWDILLDLEKEYHGRLHVAELPQNGGSTRATIEVMKLAQNEGFVFATLLDGDDVLAPGACDHLKRVLQDTGADAVYGAGVRSRERDRRGDAVLVDGFDLQIHDDPLGTWLDRPRATTALCARIDAMKADLDPAAVIQDHQLGLSIHRNSKRVVYSTGKTHYYSLAVQGENLVLDEQVGWPSAVLAYNAHWPKIRGHPKARKYQRRAFSVLTKIRKLPVFPVWIRLGLYVLTPFKVLMPGPVRHLFLIRLVRYL
jgi:glycosyltransferase involved in cell wall biosynthesis